MVISFDARERTRCKGRKDFQIIFIQEKPSDHEDFHHVLSMQIFNV